MIYESAEDVNNFVSDYLLFNNTISSTSESLGIPIPLLVAVEDLAIRLHLNSLGFSNIDSNIFNSPEVLCFDYSTFLVISSISSDISSYGDIRLSYVSVGHTVFCVYSGYSLVNYKGFSFSSSGLFLEHFETLQMNYNSLIKVPSGADLFYYELQKSFAKRNPTIYDALRIFSTLKICSAHNVSMELLLNQIRILFLGRRVEEYKKALLHLHSVVSLYYDFSKYDLNILPEVSIVNDLISRLRSRL